MELQGTVGWGDIAAGTRTPVLQEQCAFLTTDLLLQPSHAHHLKLGSHLVCFVCLVPRGKEPPQLVTHGYLNPTPLQGQPALRTTDPPLRPRCLAVCLFFVFIFFETGFLCIALAVLELTL